MILNRWQSVMAISVLVMLLLCLAVWAGVRGCDVPSDDDDSAEAWREEIREVEAEFDNMDARPDPGVL